MPVRPLFVSRVERIHALLEMQPALKKTGKRRKPDQKHDRQHRGEQLEPPSRPDGEPRCRQGGTVPVDEGRQEEEQEEVGGDPQGKVDQAGCGD